MKRQASFRQYCKLEHATVEARDLCVVSVVNLKFVFVSVVCFADVMLLLVSGSGFLLLMLLLLLLLVIVDFLGGWCSATKVLAQPSPVRILMSSGW